MTFMIDDPDSLDDEDLDAAAEALCYAYLDLVIKPIPILEPALRFRNLAEAGKEIYRELAMAVIECLRERL